MGIRSELLGAPDAAANPSLLRPPPDRPWQPRREIVPALALPLAAPLSALSGQADADQACEVIASAANWLPRH